MTQRVAHISTVHRANDTRIFHKECKTLADAGYDVTLLARKPESALDDDRIEFIQLDLGDGRGRRVLLGTWKVITTSLRLRSDVYHFHDPELIGAGLVLKALGRKVIYDVHENVPAQILSKEWLPSWIRRPMSQVVRGAHWIAGRIFDGIVVARKDALSGFRKGNVVLVENYPLMSEFLSASQRDLGQGGRSSKAVYVGGVTEIRGIKEILEAGNRVSSRRNFALELAGPIQPQSLRGTLATHPGWASVTYHEWLDREQMIDVFSTANVGLLLFHPVPNHINSYPNKLFEYMSAGLPIVCSNFDYWKQYVTDLGTGIMVDPLDTEAIASAIEWVLDHPDEAAEMGHRGREAIKHQFNWDQEKQKLLTLYDEVLSTQGVA